MNVAVINPDLASKESAVVATLLAECPDELPPYCAKLVEHAPESFDDLRLATIVVAIRALRKAGKPVAPLTVREQLNSHLDDAGGALFVESLAGQAVSITIAEYEAEAVWQAYQTRRSQSALDDALTALQSSPGQRENIITGTIATLESLTAKIGDTGLTVRQPDDLLAMTFDDSDLILGDRLLATGQSLVIAGSGSIGKSRLLLQLAVAVITGRQWLGFETRCHDLAWLILQAENSNRRLQHDLGALRDWIGPGDWPKVNSQLFVHTLECDADAFLSLDNPRTQDRIARTIAEIEPGIVAFDSLYNFGIGDLNRDEDMAATLLMLSRLARAGNPDRALIPVHHAITGRAGAARATGYDRASFGRNSKVLHSWTRGQINVAPGTADNNYLLVLSCAKCSNGKEFAPFAVQLNPDTMVYELAPDFDMTAWQAEVLGKPKHDASITVERVRELCKGAMTKKELAKAIMDDAGCVKQYAYRMVQKAEAARLIHYSKASEKYVAKV